MYLGPSALGLFCLKTVWSTALNVHICDVCVRSEWFALLNSWSKLGWRVSPWLSCWETANINFYFVFTIYSRQIRKAVPLLPSTCQTSTKLIQQHWTISWTSPLKWKRRAQARLYSYLVYCNDALWCIVTIYHIYCFFFRCFDITKAKHNDFICPWKSVFCWYSRHLWTRNKCARKSKCFSQLSSFCNTAEILWIHTSSFSFQQVKAVYHNGEPIPDRIVYLFEGDISLSSIQNVKTDEKGVAVFSLSTNELKGDVQLHVSEKLHWHL